MSKLFVYGSLKRGFLNPYAMQLQQEAQFLCEGKLRGLLLNLGRYPAVVAQTQGSTYVFGEIYKLGTRMDTLLASLDQYEGYDPQAPETGEYRRELLEVETPYGPMSCWCYTYNRSWQRGMIVKSGRWPLT
jgi:gamma-glutamylcyclotransferase (GGCT)/AIG2-like uncharacterized protein YtfP